MSMTMFAVKVKEGKEGKNGQSSIGLVYRHPIAKIGFTPAYPDLCTAWRLLSLVIRIERKKVKNYFFISRTAVETYPGNRILGWCDFKGGKVKYNVVYLSGFLSLLVLVSIKYFSVFTHHLPFLDSGVLITGKPTKYKEVYEEILQTGSALGAHVSHWILHCCCCGTSNFLQGEILDLVYMYFRGSGKAAEMKREAARSTMMVTL
ncbi:hypothetical protein RDI58_018538 [Solanum bulbocastanum]|uniref:Uncharacterized protein n=1 Tax=Solanum bulbocastanum TaxID=147425 RepID=A0AAN8YD40_SOLBU